MKQWMIVGAIIVVLVGAYLWNRNRNTDNTQETIPPVEEIITQEDGSVVRKTGDTIQPLSDEEIEAKKKEINEHLANQQSKPLAAVEGQTGSGTTASTFSDGTYYQKIMVSNLTALQKGYYYEAWLQKDDGTHVSIGRLQMTDGNGELYYSSKDDKTGYSQTIITREVEDGNKEMGAEKVLQG